MGDRGQGGAHPASWSMGTFLGWSLLILQRSNQPFTLQFYFLVLLISHILSAGDFINEAGLTNAGCTVYHPLTTPVSPGHCPPLQGASPLRPPAAPCSPPPSSAPHNAPLIFIILTGLASTPLWAHHKGLQFNGSQNNVMINQGLLHSQLLGLG